MAAEKPPPDPTTTGAAPPPDLLAERYRLLSELGRGGMGAVYRVYDTKLEEELALKLLRHQGTELSPEDRSRFLREIKTARKITHPNVVRIHDFGESGRDLFITMELLPGGTLARRMEEGIALARGLEIGAEICDGLQAAHSLGVVHRDLKPENVLFDEHDRAKLADFGLARFARSTTRTVGFSGTPLYMSPEHADGSEVTARSDLYCLGVLLYQLYSGRVPFLADNLVRLVSLHTTEPPPPLRSVVPVLPEELDRLVVSCLAKSPAARPASAAVIASQLRQIGAALPRAGSEAQTVIVRLPAPMVPGTLQPSGLAKSGAPPDSRSLTLPTWLLAAGAAMVALLGFLTVRALGPSPRETAALVARESPSPAAILPPATLPPATPGSTPPAHPRRASSPAAHPTRVAVVAPLPTPGPVAPDTGELQVTGNTHVEVFLGQERLSQDVGTFKVSAGPHLVKLVDPRSGFLKVVNVEITPGHRVHIDFNTATGKAGVVP